MKNIIYKKINPQSLSVSNNFKFGRKRKDTGAHYRAVAKARRRINKNKKTGLRNCLVIRNLGKYIHL